MRESTPSSDVAANSAVRARVGYADIAVAAIALIGLTLRLWRAWSSVPTLLTHYTPDDSYYYFEIARNVVHGHNVTFDGETLTNGFHPLWLVLMLPIFAATDDRALGLHLVLTVGALLGTASIVLLYAIVREVTGSWRGALVAAAVYAVHPYIVTESINGLETSATVFFVALSTLVFLRVVRRDSTFAVRRYLALGATLGLTMMARTDSLFIVAPIVVATIWHVESRHRKAAAVALALPFLAVIAPWVVWSLVSFGTIVQISGIAGPAVQRSSYFATHGHAVAGQIHHGWLVARDTFTQQLMHTYLVPKGHSGMPWLVIGVATLALMLFASRKMNVGQGRDVWLLLVPASGAAAAILYYSAIRWHVREYYFGASGLMIAALAGCAIAFGEAAITGFISNIAGRSGRRPYVLAVGGLYVATVAIVATLYGPQSSARWQTPLANQVNNLEAARWLSANTEPGARVGSFNAGIVGYFTTRTVVNLDGVVNEDAYHALFDGCHMKEYVDRKRLDYLVDQPQVLVVATCGEDSAVTYSKITTIGTQFPTIFGAAPEIWRVLRTSADVGASSTGS